jgi:hypothetical protein
MSNTENTPKPATHHRTIIASRLRPGAVIEVDGATKVVVLHIAADGIGGLVAQTRLGRPVATARAISIDIDADELVKVVGHLHEYERALK